MIQFRTRKYTIYAMQNNLKIEWEKHLGISKLFNSFFLGKGGEPLDEKEKIKKAVMSASKKVDFSRHFRL